MSITTREMRRSKLEIGLPEKIPAQRVSVAHVANLPRHKERTDIPPFRL
ncbi:MAG: hypothetical protein ABI600_15135 [Luteolibacter sp.]